MPGPRLWFLPSEYPACGRRPWFLPSEYPAATNPYRHLAHPGRRIAIGSGRHPDLTQPDQHYPIHARIAFLALLTLGIIAVLIAAHIVGYIPDHPPN